MYTNMADIASHSSQKAVWHLSYSNHNIFDYIYRNILVLFRLANKEHQMIFWGKKHYKKCSDIPKTLNNKTACYSPSFTLPETNHDSRVYSVAVVM